MAEQFDVKLEGLLRGTLKAEAATMPVAIGPADVLRRRELRLRQRARGRMRLLLIAALVALPLGAVLIGAPRLDPRTDGYSAVLARRSGDSEIQIMAAREGVAERLLTVPMSRLDDAGIQDALEIQVLETSPTGWLAMYAATDRVQASGYREFVVLLNLHDPDKAPVVREGTHLGAWTPDGLYWSATNHAYELIDPASGQVVSLPRGASGKFDWYSAGGGRMQVAAEGHGLLLGGPQEWGVLSPNGAMSTGLPNVAEGVGPRHVSAQWGLLQIQSNGAVSGPAVDGTFRQWGDAPPANHSLADASWAVGGGVWLLVDRRSDGRTMLLIHRDQDSVDRVVAEFPVDVDVQVSIRDLAPDDSLIALELLGETPAWQTVVVDTRSGSSHLFNGALGGFVPTAATAGAVTGERLTEAGQVLSGRAPGRASGQAYGSLPSLEQQAASLSADRILLVHEVAAAADPGPPTRLTLGPVELEQGLGVSLACTGPGEITLTEVFPGGPPSPPHTYGCLDAVALHGWEAPGVPQGSAEVLVGFDPSTAWRLIVFDPPPPRPRS